MASVLTSMDPLNYPKVLKAQEWPTLIHKRFCFHQIWPKLNSGAICRFLCISTLSIQILNNLLRLGQIKLVKILQTIMQSLININDSGNLYSPYTMRSPKIKTNKIFHQILLLFLLRSIFCPLIIPLGK